MNSVKEITVFSIGDSEKTTTWSNVPYFFTKSLLEKGIIINRVNIEEHKVISTLYKYSFYLLLKLIYPKTQHTYFRSKLNATLTNLKIKKVLKEYPQTDVYLFLTYSFGLKSIKKKQVALFSDWCYLYKIQEQEKRNPFWFEKRALQREATNINSANIVFSLFPKSNEFLKTHFKNQHNYYLGNVINTERQLNKEKIVSLKIKSNKIVFVGNHKYLQGAKALIDACLIYNTANDNKLELHIIGLSNQDLNNTNATIFCYGYLNKQLQKDNDIYYQLIEEARAIINTNEGWGGFSAITEAMYFYTPVITTPYTEFTETYGQEISFGYFVHSNEELIIHLQTIMNINNEAYLLLLNNAHDSVKDFTWKNYTQKVLDKLTN